MKDISSILALFKLAQRSSKAETQEWPAEVAGNQRFALIHNYRNIAPWENIDLIQVKGYSKYTSFISGLG